MIGEFNQYTSVRNWSQWRYRCRCHVTSLYGL